MNVRPAVAADDARLLEIDRATWSPVSSPAPKPRAGGAFFTGTTVPGKVLVAEDGGDVVGYVKIEHPTELPASGHVWHVTGLAVHPDAQGRRIGRTLIEAAADQARSRGGRRLTLRVFATNLPARRLYEQLGFELEGVLRGEFLVGDGEYVDDHFMALDLTR